MRIRDLAKRLDAIEAGGGGGGGAQTVKALALVNHGKPSGALALHDPITIEAAVPTLVRVTAYLEIEENGGFWTISLNDHDVAIHDNGDDAPVAIAASVSGWGSWALGANGVQFGPSLGTRVLDIVSPASTNEVLLDVGSHELSVGIDAALNVGVAVAPGCPDVNVRNVLFAVETLV
jgi:hypothetical protein